MNIREETLQIMTQAAHRLEERNRRYMEAGNPSSGYPRVTAPIKGQLDHDGLSILLPLQTSKNYNGLLGAFYSHCLRAIEYIGCVETSDYRGIVAMRVRNANIRSVKNLERRLLRYPLRLDKARIVPSFDMSYAASTAVSWKPQKGRKLDCKKSKVLLAYLIIRSHGATIKEAVEDLCISESAARKRTMFLIGKKFVEAKKIPGSTEKRYVPVVKEMPQGETTRDRIIDYAEKAGEFRLRDVGISLGISRYTACHHLNYLVREEKVKRMGDGFYRYI